MWKENKRIAKKKLDRLYRLTVLMHLIIVKPRVTSY